MNILITGCNGFIGKELVSFLDSTSHTVFPTSRKNLDVSNEGEVSAFFQKYKIDVVVHAAIKGGRRNQPDSIDDLLENLKMFNNLYQQSDRYKLMISFGSGAEQNLESYYGVAKNAIAKEIEKHNDNIVNMRLFGCFGPAESSDRFIKNSTNQLLKGKGAIIHQNKYMDYFYIEDLNTVVLHYINNYNDSLPKVLDLCYDNKTTLLYVAEKIKKLTNSPLDVIIENNEFGSSYIGNPSALSALSLRLYGLDEGIKRTFNILKAKNG